MKEAVGHFTDLGAPINPSSSCNSCLGNILPHCLNSGSFRAPASPAVGCAASPDLTNPIKLLTYH